MRLKDLKLHMILGIIILAVVCTFSFFYFGSYKTKIRETSLELSEVNCTSRLLEMDGNILELKSEFENSYADSRVSIVTNLKEDYENNFINKTLTCIRPACDIELTEDTTCFMYFYNISNKQVGKIDLSEIMPVDSENTYSAIINWQTGVIAESSTINTPFYSFLLSEGNSVSEDIKNYCSKYQNFNILINVSDTSYIVSGITIGADYYYVRLIPATVYNTNIRNIKVLTFLFIAILVVAFVFIFILVGLAYKKQNKLIILSRKASARNDAIIIRTKLNGDVIYCNHRIKKLILHPELFKNVKNFTTVDGKSIDIHLKTEEKIIAVFEVDESKYYIEFMIFRYNHTFYFIGNNITDEYLEKAMLENLASKNAVTDLYNYYKLVSNFSLIKDKYQEKYLSFIMINISEYKELLNLFGKELVDQIVIEVSSRITKIIDKEFVYHTDDDTFVVVIGNDTKDINAKTIEKIVASIRSLYTLKTNSLILKFKFAYLDVPLNTVKNLDALEVYSNLESTLNRVKSMINRDMLKYDTSTQNYVDYHKAMRNDIEYALSHNEFEMYYQPQYDVLENHITGFEALIRWNNPKYIHTSPQEYIEYAEKNGYIIDIGNFIIRDVFKNAKKFEPFGVHISVNVSPAQLFQAGFTSFLLEEFEKNNLKPGSIAIEITETFLMENFGVVIEKLNLLRSKGFSIHLDDFGSGYSSLQYLKDLPIDTIKTDKDFIKNITSDSYTRTIIKGIIQMAKSVDLKVISEGVETKEQADILKKFGTDYFQGYLISKAIPFNDAVDLLNKDIDIFKKKGRD